MLKGIDPVFTPDLLRALAQMGHSDELAIVDENYPAYSSGRPVVHIGGANSTEFLVKLCAIFPIDDFAADPIQFMVDPRSPHGPNPVQSEFVAAAEAAEGRRIEAGALGREDFYRRAKEASLIVVTSEPRPFGCFFVRKGVWPPIESPNSSKERP